jgi:hypothetical protein
MKLRLTAWRVLGLSLGLFLAASALAADIGANTNTAPAKPAKKKSRPAETATTTINEPGWIKLFDGKTLSGWKEADMVGHNDVLVEDGHILIQFGNDMTGIVYTNEVIRTNYEVYLEAARMDGSDFFCGLTFPVGKDPCSLILGGWGGGLVGLSSIDGADASNNQTTTFRSFENKKWYRIRLRVAQGRIETWVDDDRFIDLDTTDHTFSTRIEMEKCKPFGIASWRTSGAIRDIRWRKLDDVSPTASKEK